MAKGKYDSLLESYPEIISKEQFWKIAHVRKYTALYYLESQLLPCVDTGKPTHRYLIRTTDVVALLEDRDADPEKYVVPIAWQRKRGINRKYNKHVGYSEYTQKKLRVALEAIVEQYPDLLSPDDAAEIVGWNSKTAQRLCRQKKIEAFVVKNRLLIPKVTLVEYLLSDGCKPIVPRYRRRILKQAKLLEGQ